MIKVPSPPSLSSEENALEANQGVCDFVGALGKRNTIIFKGLERSRSAFGPLLGSTSLFGLQ